MISILKYGEVKDEEIFARTLPTDNVSDAVAEILTAVRQEGDKALLAFEKRFDGAELPSLLVSEEEIRQALTLVEPEFLEILKEAAANIRAFHEKQKRTSFLINDRPGVVMGQKIIPLDRVGLYVPGGTAAYPSTVLMDAIPAKIAGCRELIITTPPRRDGTVIPVILAAAATVSSGPTVQPLPSKPGAEGTVEGASINTFNGVPEAASIRA